jgi:hypothetical protein
MLLSFLVHALYYSSSISYPEFHVYKTFLFSHEYQIFQKIVKLEYEVPDGFPSDAKDLVTKLLVCETIVTQFVQSFAIKNTYFYEARYALNVTYFELSTVECIRQRK